MHLYARHPQCIFKWPTATLSIALALSQKLSGARARAVHLAHFGRLWLGHRLATYGLHTAWGRARARSRLDILDTYGSETAWTSLGHLRLAHRLDTAWTPLEHIGHRLNIRLDTYLGGSFGNKTEHRNIGTSEKCEKVRKSVTKC